MAIADGFHVDNIGNHWIGSNRETFDATTRSEAPFYVSADGNLVAKSGTFSGNLSAAGGDFSGDISGASGTFTGNLSGSSISGGSININNNFIVDSSGNLTANNATLSGYLTSSSDISGDRISGGTIQGTTINAGNLTVTGQFQFGDVNISSNDIVGTIDNGAITDNKIDTLSFNKLTGVSISANDITTGTLNAALIGGAALSMAFNITSTGGRIRAYNGLESTNAGGYVNGDWGVNNKVYHTGNSNTYLDLGSSSTVYLRVNGGNTGLQLSGTGSSFVYSDWRPSPANSHNLGSSFSTWAAVYAVDTTINTSDINYKTDIEPITLGLDFIKTLDPIEYRWADRGDGTEGVRTHLGFSAQDIKQKLIDYKGETQNYAMYTQGSYENYEAVDEDGNLVEDLPEDWEKFGLRMSELIPSLVKSVQELSAKNDELESRLAALEG